MTSLKCYSCPVVVRFAVAEYCDLTLCFPPHPVMTVVPELLQPFDHCSPSQAAAARHIFQWSTATRAQPMTLTTCHTIGPLRCLLLETPHRTTAAQRCRLTAGAARHECSLTQSFKWKLILSSVKEWKMFGFLNQNLKIEIEKERGVLLSS